jgi:thioester reductase-like protein
MGKVLLTGASGYLGKKILIKLLSSGQEVITPLRASRSSDFENRKQDFLQRLPESYHSQLNIVPGDLASWRENLRSETADIRHIVHNAAVTAFNVDEQTANQVNRDGTREMLMLARECPRLDQFMYVSTVYASGTRAGLIEEKIFEPRPDFANHYERSKWESENMLANEFKDLPWTIARVATVIAEDDSGLVIQQNAIHNTLKLFFYGLISLLPGLRQTPIYLVEGNFVADSLAEVMTRAKSHEIFHLCHGRKATVSLERFMDIAFEEFIKDESFKSRRLLKPLFADEKSFETLASNMKSFGGSVLSQGLSSIAPFGKQLFIEKDIRNDRLQATLAAYQAPDMELLIRRTCAHLAKSKFAKVP